jgi:hypothetical protein
VGPVLSLQLAALGAPADLLRRTHEAALDEVRHAERCYSLASDFGAERYSAGAIPAFAAPGRGEPVTFDSVCMRVTGRWLPRRGHRGGDRTARRRDRDRSGGRRDAGDDSPRRSTPRRARVGRPRVVRRAREKRAAPARWRRVVSASRARVAPRRPPGSPVRALHATASSPRTGSTRPPGAASPTRSTGSTPFWTMSASPRRPVDARDAAISRSSGACAPRPLRKLDRGKLAIVNRDWLRARALSDKAPSASRSRNAGTAQRRNHAPMDKGNPKTGPRRAQQPSWARRSGPWAVRAPSGKRQPKRPRSRHSAPARCP